MENYNLKPINNTFTTEAYGMAVSFMAPADCIICGYQFQVNDDAHSMIEFDGQLYIYTKRDDVENLSEWFKGFIMEVNGSMVNIEIVQMGSGIGGSQAHIYEALYGEWGKGYTLVFKAMRKPQLTPMDIAKALVEDKIQSANPGVAAIYTREVMEQVLADFLNSGVIRECENEAPVRPWDVNNG